MQSQAVTVPPLGTQESPGTALTSDMVVAWMVGQLLLNFGQLDHLVFCVLQRVLPEKDYQDTKRWHLTDRVDRMIERLTVEDASLKPHVDQWRADFLPVRDLRNHLAHGYLMLACGPPVTLNIRQARDWDGEEVTAIGSDELQRCFAKLDELILQLQPWAGYQPDTECMNVDKFLSFSECRSCPTSSPSPNAPR